MFLVHWILQLMMRFFDNCLLQGAYIFIIKFLISMSPYFLGKLAIDSKI